MFYVTLKNKIKVFYSNLYMYCIFAVDQTKLLKALLITVSILFTAYNTTVFLLQYENIMVSFLLMKTTHITFWNICKFEKKFFIFSNLSQNQTTVQLLRELFQSNESTLFPTCTIEGVIRILN